MSDISPGVPLVDVDRLVAVVRTLVAGAVGALATWLVAVLALDIDLNGPEAIAVISGATAVVYAVARWLETTVPAVGRIVFIITQPPTFASSTTSMVAGTVRTLVNTAVIAAAGWAISRYQLDVDLNSPVVINVMFVATAVLYPLSLWLVDRVPALGRLLFLISSPPSFGGTVSPS